MSTITLDELRHYACNDFDGRCTVEEAWNRMTSGDSGHSASYVEGVGYPETPEGHKCIRHTEEYIQYLANILRAADEWPFPPLKIRRQSCTLWDGHHRAQAALLVNWDKPIHVTAPGWY